MQIPRRGERRSRNIGTKKQGHGQDNRLVIPFPFHAADPLNGRQYFERLSDLSATRLTCGEQEIDFLVEATVLPYSHAYSIEDLQVLMGFVPSQDIAGLDFLVLRQPKRKEEILNPVWGRWNPYVTFLRREGTAIMLEAIRLDKPIIWSRSLSPFYARELQRLSEEEHRIVHSKRDIEIWPCLQSVRNTQLRTLFHEIGHHVDFKREPACWQNRSWLDKETFAHSYADQLLHKLRREGVLPF